MLGRRLRQMDVQLVRRRPRFERQRLPVKLDDHHDDVAARDAHDSQRPI
jgi:hypothetical protein